MLKEIRILFYF